MVKFSNPILATTFVIQYNGKYAHWEKDSSFYFLLLTILGVLATRGKLQNPPTKTPVRGDLFNGISYVPANPRNYDISILSSDLSAPTRIKITPDAKYLLVSQITGEVFAFTRTDNGWSKNPEKILTIETRFPGFPPDEAGLVGIIFLPHTKKPAKLFFFIPIKIRVEKSGIELVPPNFSKVAVN